MPKWYIKFSLMLTSLAITTFLFWSITRYFSNAYINNSNTTIINAPEYDNVPLKNTIKYIDFDGVFDLPISGASAYASIDMYLYESPSTNSKIVRVLNAGSGFTVLNEIGDFWQVEIGNQEGYVLSEYCFINLPDIIPSIIYKNTNASASIMKSSNIDIDNITNQKLYDTYYYNERLKKQEYVMPVLYNTAKKIYLAQQEALSNNETLIIYESYRPYNTQRTIVKNLNRLASENTFVYNGLNSKPWTMTWFISTKISNHQKGLAIDVSLGKVNKLEDTHIGKYHVKTVSNYTEYTMPTPMHELSINSARFTTPVYSHSKTAWKNAEYSPAMKKSLEAQRLQDYCTNAGLTPLASEWWHYNDLDSLNSHNSIGNFSIDNVYSKIPV